MTRMTKGHKTTPSSTAIKRVSVLTLRRAIQTLPADKPVKRPGVSYLTQKEHWLRWLKDYNTSGAYSRIPRLNRDARYAYNHIVQPKMLLWLLPAAGVRTNLVRAARSAAAREKTMMAQSGAIRRVVPWEVVAERLWPMNFDARKQGGRAGWGRRSIGQIMANPA